MKKIFILHSVAWLSRWTVILLYFHWFPPEIDAICSELRMHDKNEANLVQSFTCAKFIVPFTSVIVHGYSSIEYWIHKQSFSNTIHATIWICNKVWANLVTCLSYLFIFHSFAIESASLTGRDSLNIPIPLGLQKGSLFFAWFLVVYVYFDDGNGHLGSHHPFWCTFFSIHIRHRWELLRQKFLVSFLFFLLGWNAEWSGGKNKNQSSVYDLKGKW